MSVRQQYRREYGKGLPHKKPIASETDARKMQSFARLGGLKEAPASIGGEYFTFHCTLLPVYRMSWVSGSAGALPDVRLSSCPASPCIRCPIFWGM